MPREDSSEAEIIRDIRIFPQQAESSSKIGIFHQDRVNLPARTVPAPKYSQRVLVSVLPNMSLSFSNVDGGGRSFRSWLCTLLFMCNSLGMLVPLSTNGAPVVSCPEGADVSSDGGGAQDRAPAVVSPVFDHSRQAEAERFLQDSRQAEAERFLHFLTIRTISTFQVQAEAERFRVSTIPEATDVFDGSKASEKTSSSDGDSEPLGTPPTLRSKLLLAIHQRPTMSLLSRSRALGHLHLAYDVCSQVAREILASDQKETLCRQLCVDAVAKVMEVSPSAQWWVAATGRALKSAGEKLEAVAALETTTVETPRLEAVAALERLTRPAPLCSPPSSLCSSPSLSRGTTTQGLDEQDGESGGNEAGNAQAATSRSPGQGEFVMNDAILPYEAVEEASIVRKAVEEAMEEVLLLTGSEATAEDLDLAERPVVRVDGSRLPIVRRRSQVCGSPEHFRIYSEVSLRNDDDLSQAGATASSERPRSPELSPELSPPGSCSPESAEDEEIPISSVEGASAGCTGEDYCPTDAECGFSRSRPSEPVGSDEMLAEQPFVRVDGSGGLPIACRRSGNDDELSEAGATDGASSSERPRSPATELSLMGGRVLDDDALSLSPESAEGEIPIPSVEGTPAEDYCPTDSESVDVVNRVGAVHRSRLTTGLWRMRC